MLILKKIYKLLLVVSFLSTSIIADEVASLANNNNSCYKTRDIMYGLDDVFDALKKTLLQANLNIVTVTKNDGVLTAKGSQYNDEEETITDITMSISFKQRKEEHTSVTAIASYSTREKKSEIGQLGAAGISLPIPVPLSGRYVITGSGNIDESAWFQGFFTSVDLALFEEKMKYIGDEKLVAQLQLEKEAIQKVEDAKIAKKVAAQKAIDDEKIRKEAEEKAKANEVAKKKAEQKAKADKIAKEEADKNNTITDSETTNDETITSDNLPDSEEKAPKINNTNESEVPAQN